MALRWIRKHASSNRVLTGFVVIHLDLVGYTPCMSLLRLSTRVRLERRED